MPGSSVTRTVLFRTVIRSHTVGFCAHGSLHLYVSLRRAPSSRHLVKAPFSGFRVVLVRLFATPETSVLLHSLVFHYFSLCFSISTERPVSQEPSSISPYSWKSVYIFVPLSCANLCILQIKCFIFIFIYILINFYVDIYICPYIYLLYL